MKDSFDTARLIALDWGTSSLRAMLLGPDGNLLAQRDAPCGVMQVTNGDFAGVFAATVGDWQARSPGLPMIASGMIGSAQGWREAPYCRGLAGAAELATTLLQIPVADDRVLHVVPGVALTEPRAEVMRGEETQVVGATVLDAALADRSRLVLPGTHSKWITVEGGRIVQCQTFMTGELFAVLRQHSILGRLFSADDQYSADSSGAFDSAVETARDAKEGVAPLLFSARAKVLLGQLPRSQSLEYLSGLLIGDEIRAALGGETTRLAVIGDAALCGRYRRAMRHFGMGDVQEIRDAARIGLWRIAVEAGLVVQECPTLA
ncbi:2-dehydro-3-deoxygalactonokinase [Paraburkholderia sp. DHOC27]|uniref:2-dehydro-3-deoxygalactonokinase n=1 Tax=Paraburkholderia sp. DHOC27 TaxID=2303330 RepID=UPI000E3E1E5F|nr:2-dehydro-3-deoxygalactonokinase [Paraburkholderia sp. DHOC27]RFU49769.1 2-dehydro-3-deoxygalactonokinase [Paraburkholderia sp. DHOC27]